MSTTELDAVVREYFRRLDNALRGLPRARREELRAEIAQHIDDARAGAPIETEAGLRELLDRVGAPEDIAAAALADEARPQRPHRVWTIVAAVLVALLAVGVVVAVLRGGKHVPATVTMPSVLGSSVAHAETTLRHAFPPGVDVRVKRSPDQVVPAGSVIAQVPAAGTTAKRDAAVTLTVSDGPIRVAGWRFGELSVNRKTCEAAYVFAGEKRILIDHVGTYSYTSPFVTLPRAVIGKGGVPAGFASGGAVEGNVSIQPDYRNSHQLTQGDRYAFRVVFRVSSYSGRPDYHFLGARARAYGGCSARR